MKGAVNSGMAIRLRIDTRTLARHTKFFERGDYSRIAEMTGVTRSNIADCFKSGKATQPVAQAMKSFYAKKEKIQRSLAA